MEASKSVSPNCTRAIAEESDLLGQLLSVANLLVSQNQSVAGERHRERQEHEAVLHSKNAEMEQLLRAEVQLQEEHEQQLLLERQQWCSEKDTLQKVLQEQQGTAHTVEQHLTAQITALQDQLAQQHSGQQSDAQEHQESLKALQTSHEQLQQQHSKLQQDLQAALAYRHKCIQQKQELQQLRDHTSGAQLRSIQDQAAAEEVSDDQQADLKAMPPHGVVAGVNSPTSSTQDLAALVVKLKGERELVKRAYLEEKKKADRYRNAYIQLRDLKQPSQRRSKHRSASLTATATQSMPQLQCLARQQVNTTQLATTCKPDPDQTWTSSTAEGSKLHKPYSKPKRGPTQHNHFTAEMDLAAAGLLGQPPPPPPPPPMPVPPKAACDRLQTGLSWPLRPKRSLEHQQQQQQLTHQHSGTGQAAAQQLCEQGEAGGRLCRVECVGEQSVPRDRCERQGNVSSDQELSPGAKEALILAGLLSEDQDETTANDTGEEETSALSEQQQQKVADEHEVRPWQARLAGHADAIQQLDKDSLCRLSDPCQHPSKRSRSCPPDSFGAAPHQPADSTDAVHAACSSNDAPSDCEDNAMSGQASDAASAGHTGQVVRSGPDLHQPRLPDAVTLLEAGAVSHQAVRPVSSILPVVAVVAAQQQQQDSLDMTQPNLTPADQRHRLPAQDRILPRTAPIGLLPANSLLRPAAGLDPDRGLAAAVPSSSRPHSTSSCGHKHTPQDHRRPSLQPQEHQQQAAMGQQGSGPVALGKGKAAKWKQRAGVRDNGFGENERPTLASDDAAAWQGAGAVQQCWLQQGVGQAAAGPAVLVDSVQHAQGSGAGYKYQDVVRRKADRAALEGIQCLDCQSFYEAVGTWGHQGEALPACGHVQPPGTSREGMQQSTGASVRQGLHQDASRHRYRFAPPATPEGLWEMGFGDSQDSRI